MAEGSEIPTVEREQNAVAGGLVEQETSVVEGGAPSMEGEAAEQKSQSTVDRVSIELSTQFEAEFARLGLGELVTGTNLQNILTPTLAGILPAVENDRRQTFGRLAVDFQARLRVSLRQNDLCSALRNVALYALSTRAAGATPSLLAGNLRDIESRVATSDSDRDFLARVSTRLQELPPMLPAPASPPCAKPAAPWPDDPSRQSRPPEQPTTRKKIRHLIAESMVAQEHGDWKKAAGLQREIIERRREKGLPLATSMVIFVRCLINIGELDEAAALLDELKGLPDFRPAKEDGGFIDRATRRIEELRQGKEPGGGMPLELTVHQRVQRLISCAIEAQHRQDWALVIDLQLQILEITTIPKKPMAILIRALLNAERVDEAAEYLSRFMQLTSEIDDEDRDFVELISGRIKKLRARKLTDAPAVANSIPPADSLVAPEAHEQQEGQTFELKTLKGCVVFLNGMAPTWMVFHKNPEQRLVPQRFRSLLDVAWLKFGKIIQQHIDVVAERSFWNCISALFGLATGKMHAVDLPRLKGLMDLFLPRIEFIDAFVSVPEMVSEPMPAAEPAPETPPPAELLKGSAPAAAESPQVVETDRVVGHVSLPDARTPASTPSPPRSGGLPPRVRGVFVDLKRRSKVAKDDSDWEKAVDLLEQLIDFADEHRQPMAAPMIQLINALINLGEADEAWALLDRLQQLPDFDREKGEIFVVRATSSIEELWLKRGPTKPKGGCLAQAGPAKTAVSPKESAKAPPPAPKEPIPPPCTSGKDEEETDEPEEEVDEDETPAGLNIDYSRFDRTLASLARELEKCEMHEQGELWRVLPDHEAEKLTNIFKNKRRLFARHYSDDPKRFPHPDNAGKRVTDKKKKGKEEKGKKLKSLYSQLWKEFGIVEEMIQGRLVNIEALHRLIRSLPADIGDHGRE